MIEPGQVELAAMVSPETFDAVADQAREAMAADGKSSRLAHALNSLAGPRIAAAIDAKLRQMDLLPLFIRGWGKNPAIEKAAEASAGDEDPRYIRLGKLEQDLDLYPILGISGFGLTASPIQFTLTMKGEFEAIEVGMHKGYVIQIGGGVCRLGAVLKFGQMTFPSGCDPVEWQVGKGRKFAEPGIAVLPQKGG